MKPCTNIGAMGKKCQIGQGRGGHLLQRGLLADADAGQIRHAACRMLVHDGLQALAGIEGGRPLHQALCALLAVGTVMAVSPNHTCMYGTQLLGTYLTIVFLKGAGRIINGLRD